MPEQEYNRVFANNLNKYLAEYDMSQVELASRIGVSAAAVSTWCRGEKSPRMDKVDAMCAIFHCRRSDLMEESGSTTGYYLDPETARVAQEILDDPHLHALFDAAMDAKPEDLKMAAEMLRRFKGTNPDG